MHSCTYLTTFFFFFNQKNSIDSTEIISSLFCCICSFKKTVSQYLLSGFFPTHLKFTLPSRLLEKTTHGPYHFPSCHFCFLPYLTVSHLLISFSVLPFTLIPLLKSVWFLHLRSAVSSSVYTLIHHLEQFWVDSNLNSSFRYLTEHLRFPSIVLL